MCKHHMNCVHHLHGNACTTQIKWITWTACNMCFGLISVLLYLGIQFHFHMVVFIPFKTKKAKNWHFFLVQKFFLRQPVYPWQWQWTHINWIYQKLKHLWAQFCLDVSGRIANCLMRPLLLKMISSLWHTRWCSHLTPRSGVSGEFFYYIIPPTSPPFCNCDNCKCNQWCWWFQRFWWSC